MVPDDIKNVLAGFAIAGDLVDDQLDRAIERLAGVRATSLA